MSDLVRDAIAAELEALSRIQDAPAAPYGYGSDLSCAGDLDERMSEVDGSSTLALAQAIARRLDCPRGKLPDDPDYGMDLRGYCNRGITAAEVRSLATRIQHEVAKDDRVASARVTLTPSPTGSSLRVEIAIVPADPSTAFGLTLAVTSADVLIDAIRGAQT